MRTLRAQTSAPGDIHHRLLGWISQSGRSPLSEAISAAKAPTATGRALKPVSTR